MLVLTHTLNGAFWEARIVIWILWLNKVYHSKNNNNRNISFEDLF